MRESLPGLGRQEGSLDGGPASCREGQGQAQSSFEGTDPADLDSLVTF